MSSLQRRLIVCIPLLLALVITACSGSRSVPTGGLAPQANAQTGSAVSVFGDSEAAVLQAAAEAKLAGKTPRYVTVTAPSRSYVFSVYAQLLRSTNALIVRAYGRVYVFPAAQTQVYYSANPSTNASSALPLVSAPGLDALASVGIPENAATRLIVCPDCVALLMPSNGSETLATRWNGQIDPWQANPDYIPWRPVPSGSSEPDLSCRDTKTRGAQPDIVCGPNSSGYFSTEENSFCVDCGGGYGGYSIRVPKATWNLTAEKVCAQQGGRWVDVWAATPQNGFFCSYPSTTQAQADYVASWEDNVLVCDVYFVLPAKALPPTTVIVYMGLSSGGVFTTTGIRIDAYSCTIQTAG